MNNLEIVTNDKYTLRTGLETVEFETVEEALSKVKKMIEGHLELLKDKQGKTTSSVLYVGGCYLTNPTL